MADIRINALPLATGPTAPSALDNVAIDGASTRRSTLSGLADAIRPVASQAEAEAGVNAVKAITPLTAKQSIASEVGVSLASHTQGMKADSALQPGASQNDISGLTSALAGKATSAQGAKADNSLQRGAPSPSLTTVTSSTDLNDATVAGDWTLTGSYTNGPLGAGSTTYTSTLKIQERSATAGSRYTQEMNVHASGVARKYYRIATGANGSVVWTPWREFLFVDGGTAFATAAQGTKADSALQPGTAIANISGLTTELAGKATAAQGAKADTAIYLLGGVPTLLNYTASGDGSTPDNAAFTAMASALGYIVVPKGVFRLTSMTIAVPIYFMPGGALTCVSGATITITNRIESPRQFIFQGAGSYKLNIAATVGEDSRMVHASWFGIFPQNGDTATNATAAIGKMFDSMSQGREGVIDFDSGSYRINWDQLVIPRGVWLRGSGIRRTTFDIVGASTSSSKMFRTGGTAGKITGIQFEHPAEEAASTHLGTLISIDHDDWYVEDIRCWDTEFGVVLNGNRCEAHNIQSVYGAAMPSGSSTVVVTGTGCVVDNVRVLDTSNGPTSIVLVGGANNLLSIEGTRVSNVRTTEFSIPVYVFAANDANIRNTITEKIQAWGPETDVAVAGVRIRTTGNGSVNLCYVDGVLVNGSCQYVVLLEQTSTAYIRDVIMDGLVAIGAGDGIRLSQSAGVLSDITIGDNVDVSDRGLPVVRTGSSTEIRVGRNVGAGATSIDAGVTLSIPTPDYNGTITIIDKGASAAGLSPQISSSGCALFDTGSSPEAAKAWGGANFNVLPGDITGTPTGNIVVGVVGNNVKILNNTGATKFVRWYF